METEAERGVEWSRWWVGWAKQESEMAEKLVQRR